MTERCHILMSDAGASIPLSKVRHCTTGRYRIHRTLLHDSSQDHKRLPPPCPPSPSSSYLTPRPLSFLELFTTASVLLSRSPAHSLSLHPCPRLCSSLRSNAAPHPPRSPHQPSRRSQHTPYCHPNGRNPLVIRCWRSASRSVPSHHHCPLSPTVPTQTATALQYGSSLTPPPPAPAPIPSRSLSSQLPPPTRPSVHHSLSTSGPTGFRSLVVGALPRYTTVILLRTSLSLSPVSSLPYSCPELPIPASASLSRSPSL